MKTTAKPGNNTQHSSLRSMLLLVMLLLCLTGGFLAYRYFFVTVRYELLLQPEHLPAIPGNRSVLQVTAVSRSGNAVPCLLPRIHCDVLQGGELVRINYNNDSTQIVLTATGVEGRVQLRISTPDWPFPLLADIPVITPLARGRIQSDFLSMVA